VLLKSKNIILILLIIFFIPGCSTKNNINQPEKNKNEYKSNSIIYYGQELAIPQGLVRKIYSPHNIVNIHKDKELIHKNGKFIGKNMPYYIINFDKTIYLSEIKIYNTGVLGMPLLRIRNDKTTFFTFDPISFLLDNKPIPKKVYMATAKDSNLVPIEFLIDENKEYIKIILKEPKYTDQLHIAIAEIENPPISKNAEVLKEYTFDFVANDFNYIDNIIINNLKNRNDLFLNEELIRNIALKDKRLFKKLKKQSHKFNVTKYSLINLPHDADITYAINNYSNVVESRVYKNIQGKRKVWKITSENDSNVSLFKVKELNIEHVEKTKEEIKKADDKIISSDYIDFSQGI